MCRLRFDSEAIFSTLLDDKKGGFFKIAPLGDYELDPRKGDSLGNFPQLFVHAALIDVTHNIDDFMKKS